MIKLFLGLQFLFLFSLTAELQTLDSREKKELDQVLRIFTMAEKMPELWPAILKDLKPYKETKGQETIVKFFEKRLQKDWAAYEKDFTSLALEAQEKNYKEHEDEINKHIDEAKKVFANVDKESTKASWPHMTAVKQTLSLSANDVLSANLDLKQLRNQLKGLVDMVSYFQKDSTFNLGLFENFTLSRCIFFANADYRDIMKANESSTIPLGIKQGIRDLNIMRLIFGQGVLAVNVKLCAASTDHSKDMNEKGFFAHESPVPGKKTPWDRAKNFETVAHGENIAMGMRDSFGANKGWFLSPGHFKNMFKSSFKKVGLGGYERHWTQMLAR
jgi:hypothetical protein